MVGLPGGLNVGERRITSVGNYRFAFPAKQQYTTSCAGSRSVFAFIQLKNPRLPEWAFARGIATICPNRRQFHIHLSLNPDIGYGRLFGLSALQRSGCRRGADAGIPGMLILRVPVGSPANRTLCTPRSQNRDPGAPGRARAVGIIGAWFAPRCSSSWRLSRGSHSMAWRKRPGAPGSLALERMRKKTAAAATGGILSPPGK